MSAAIDREARRVGWQRCGKGRRGGDRGDRNGEREQGKECEAERDQRRDILLADSETNVINETACSRPAFTDPKDTPRTPHGHPKDAKGTLRTGTGKSYKPHELGTEPASRNTIMMRG